MEGKPSQFLARPPLANVRYWSKSGKQLLTVSFSQFDPKRTSRCPCMKCSSTTTLTTLNSLHNDRRYSAIVLIETVGPPRQSDRRVIDVQKELARFPRGKGR